MRYRFCRDVRYRRILGEAVVIRQDASEVMGINAAGARILDGVRDGRDTDAIVDGIVGELEVGRDEARRDLEAFLVEMTAAGVVERADGPNVGER